LPARQRRQFFPSSNLDCFSSRHQDDNPAIRSFYRQVSFLQPQCEGNVTGILEDLFSTLNFDASVRDVRVGLFHTGVLTRSCGLASSLPRDVLKQQRPAVKQPCALLDKSALELAKMAYSQSILEAAIGMAAVNSLLDIGEEYCQDLNARDLIAEKGKGRNIVIIGHFPFIPDLEEAAKRLWVIEKNPSEGDCAEAEAENLIPKADVIGITGTAFTNHTIDQLLRFCSS